MRLRVHIGSLLLSFLLGGWTGCFGLNPQLELSQYGHTSWTVRDGFSLGNVYAMAQTPDGYLWLGSEFGLFRFDGVRFAAWQPPSGQRLPGNGVYSLLVTQDGTLWIAAEALRNAFRHVQANRVEVEIRYDDQQFRLRVRDDGRGMDATAVSRQEPERHFGVSGMRERAALARGKLVIWSTPGADTEMELRIPAGAAYTKDLTGSLRSRTLAGKA